MNELAPNIHSTQKGRQFLELANKHAHELDGLDIQRETAATQETLRLRRMVPEENAGATKIIDTVVQIGQKTVDIYRKIAA
jgi:hypothetical protein